jgi:hypothetical protein
MSVARNPSFSAHTVHRKLRGWEALRGILRINIQGGCNFHFSANVCDAKMNCVSAKLHFFMRYLGNNNQEYVAVTDGRPSEAPGCCGT